MNGIRHYRLTPMLLLAAALLLRAAIPAGYMPAAAGSGLLFEFCPEGVPVEFVQFLTGDTGQHHQHTAHGDSGHHGHDNNGGHDSHHGDHLCPVGHMLLSAAAVDDGWQTEVAPLAPALAASSEYSYFYVSLPFYRPRDPPA